MDEVEAVDRQAIGFAFGMISSLGLGIAIAENSMRGWSTWGALVSATLALAIVGCFLVFRSGKRSERLLDLKLGPRED